MSKIESFKRICFEMEQRKQNLDKEVDEYVVMNENLKIHGAYVSSENNVIDPDNNVPQNLKNEYNYKFSKIYEHIQQQSQWITEISQAYKDAKDEILEQIKQISQCVEFTNYIQHNMEILAQVSRANSIDYGEQALLKITHT